MKIENYINGQLVAPLSGSYIDSINPATGEKINDVPVSNEADIQAAITAAENAFPAWSALTHSERAAYLTAIAKEINNQLETLAMAEVVDNGKTITQATKIDIPRSAANFQFFADAIVRWEQENFDNATHTNTVLRQPLGVVACISPWNLPLYLFTWKIAPALAVGNCVVAKPSEVTPLTAYLLSKICIKVGLPAGVLNIVHGNGAVTGNAMIHNAGFKAISFTGSTAVGKQIAKAAAENLTKVSLELGGKNAAIVFADCDIDTTVKELARASFSNQGEICLCSSRLLIEETIYETFKEKFIAETKKWTVGNPLLATTRVGAIVSKQHFDKIVNAIAAAKQEGGVLLCGGNTVQLSGDNTNGLFIEPTIFENLPNTCSINQEEVFGPVVTLQKFATTTDAVALANDSSYGLSATIWTTNPQKANEVAAQVQAGVIWINCWLVRDLRTPFGGMKNSGIGREGGNEALRFFTEAKNVCAPK